MGGAGGVIHDLPWSDGCGGGGRATLAVSAAAEEVDSSEPGHDYPIKEQQEE